jgi:malate dehydrogenase (oxaloacetate-decarboxylating)
VAIANLLIAAGFRAGNMMLVDHLGILEPEREDMDKLMMENPLKYKLAIDTNSERKKGDIESAMKGSDVVISASRSEAGFIHKEWVSGMNDDAIVFALANPTPEIWPHDAKDAGAMVVATGRSDFPNQINNSLIFPSLFRGVLDARAKGVNFDVMIAASEEIANFVSDPQPDKIVPTMDEWEMYPEVAATVAYKTAELGLARQRKSREWFRNNAQEIIENNRRLYQSILKEGFIKKMEVL